MDKAKADRDALAHAKEVEKFEEQARKRALIPEHARIWSLSPFAQLCAHPTRIDIHRNIPLNAHRFADLTHEYLKEVRIHLIFFVVEVVVI